METPLENSSNGLNNPSNLGKFRDDSEIFAELHGNINSLQFSQDYRSGFWESPFDKVPDISFFLDSLKWNTYPGDILPMFVADMDFESPQEISHALITRAERRYYGYSYIYDRLSSTIQNMMQARHQFQVEKESIICLPGLVSGLGAIARVANKSDGSIIVPTPCYPPFWRTSALMDAETILTPMIQDFDGIWAISLGELDKAADLGGKTLLLNNPHNPTGHVFSRNELLAIGAWAKARNIIIVADEIHCDLILEPDLKHIPIASLSHDLAQRTITLTAPSKTYNIAGIGMGIAIIENENLRDRFIKAAADIIPKPNIFALTACEVAYSQCDYWRDELVDYLRDNRDLVIRTLAPYSSLLQVSKNDATYLSWINCSGTQWTNPAQEFLTKGKIAVSDGAEFKAPNFVRLNFGCPKVILQEGLRRMIDTLKST